MSLIFQRRVIKYFNFLKNDDDEDFVKQNTKKGRRVMEEEVENKKELN